MKRLVLFLVLVFSVVAWAEEAGECDANGNCGVKNAPIKKKIAIVGGGIGGSSSAYYISQLIPEAEITLYEKDPHVCGRVQDTLINGQKVEVGGSIYHESNLNVDGFVSKFNLSKTSPFSNSSVGFVFRGSDIPILGEIVNIAKMFYRYGMTPYNLKNYLNSLMGNWSTLYEITEPFSTVDEFFERMGLNDEATSLAPEHLEKHGISRLFTKEILGSMTRVNYNTDVSIMNAFGVAVSAIGSGDDVYGVKEGNKYICSNLVSTAKANSKYGETVQTITLDSSSSTPKYTIETDKEKEEYDAVVIATPLELANIKFKNVEIDDYVFKARKYQEVHVTFVAGQLNPEYFNLSPSPSSSSSSSSSVLSSISSFFTSSLSNTKVPSMVLTIEDDSIPFSSIGRSGNVTDESGRPVSKVFSRKPFTQELIDKVFINGSVVFKKMIHAYPILKPTKQFVPVILSPSLFYVNSMESVISTIETETISSKNIARLLAKSWLLPYSQQL